MPRPFDHKRPTRGPALPAVRVPPSLPASAARPLDPHPPKMAPRTGIPKPGPANLRPGAGLDEWLEEAKQCHYLPESVMKELCEMVKEVLMEGM